MLKQQVLEATEIGGSSPTLDTVPSNGSASIYEAGIPYVVTVTIQGTSDMLFHAWNCEVVEANSKAAKGSKAKKTDNVESFVYRNEEGILCLPGDYLRGSIINAAKFRQDPRSPRKSAMDLFKAAVVNLTPLAPLGKETWDYEHKGRVTIQRSAVTRTRPAIKAGWRATFQLLVNLPEYVAPDILNETIQNAGRFVGVGDYRPTYGRFQVVAFEVEEACK